MRTQKRKRESGEQRFYLDFLFESSSSYESSLNSTDDEEETYSDSPESTCNDNHHEGHNIGYTSSTQSSPPHQVMTIL
jgi:hypothetical protein